MRVGCAIDPRMPTPGERVLAAKRDCSRRPWAWHSCSNRAGADASASDITSQRPVLRAGNEAKHAIHRVPSHRPPALHRRPIRPSRLAGFSAHSRSPRRLARRRHRPLSRRQPAHDMAAPSHRYRLRDQGDTVDGPSASYRRVHAHHRRRPGFPHDRSFRPGLSRQADRQDPLDQIQSGVRGHQRRGPQGRPGLCGETRAPVGGVSQGQCPGRRGAQCPIARRCAAHSNRR